MTTKTARLDRLEKGAAVALQKKRGCNEADTWANFVYDCYKRWETWWLCVKWQWPPSPAEFLRTNEREAIEAWRAQLQAGIEDPAQRAELAAFCDDLLKLPTRDDSDDDASWVRMSIDGVCPVSDPGWCVEQWRKLAHDPIRSAGEVTTAIIATGGDAGRCGGAVGSIPYVA